MQALSIEGLASSLERQYPVRLVLSNKRNRIQLELIEVSSEYRNQGFGTEILHALINYSELRNQPIELTPSGDFGSNNKLVKRYNLYRLRKFYKRLGFIQQSGRRHYDMIRNTN